MGLLRRGGGGKERGEKKKENQVKALLPCSLQCPNTFAQETGVCFSTWGGRTGVLVQRRGIPSRKAAEASSGCERGLCL